ncbi:valacyclovir hydrolase isoform X1 [Electrophorus electricus]|uniref:AB hydrolase-1 domain-containing protein n=1 Tax=Electrophorus electricus TaxID=8005 RepID=A0A4W4H6U0_ELEEL|nr:valacyclovir hydrolase isoform X1 [Electrophorus electricus]
MATLFCKRRLFNVIRRIVQNRSLCSSMSVSSGRKSVNGVDLFYQQTGKGDHSVLLLPGALGSGQTDFAPQLDKLDKRRFTVVAWDPRGYGHSRPPVRDFPIDFFHRDAKDAVDLMQALGFSRFSLLGWSDGGITALIAAALNPALIRKMVVWGSNAYVSEQDVQIYNAIRDTSLWSERMRQPMEKMYGAQYFRETWERWVDGICQFKSRPEGNICKELLELIDCPTLIVHGAKDPMVPSFHPEYLLQNIRSSRMHVMPEGKHNLHLRFATEFNSLVEAFLSE